jgi:hypothetical protein
MDVGEIYNKIIGRDLAPPKVYYDAGHRYESFNSINLSNKFKIKLSKCGLYYDINAEKFVCVFCNTTLKTLSKKSISAHNFSKSCPMSLQLLSTDPALRKSSFDQYKRGAVSGSHGAMKHEKELVENGFFYTGKRDEMCCAHCGLIIVKLHDDDCVEIIHKMYSPQCIFVIRPSAPPLQESSSLVAAETAKAVRIDRSTANSNNIFGKRNRSVSDGIDSNNDDKKDNGYVGDDRGDVNDSSKIDDGDEERLCKICFVNNRQICFFPCRHIMACSQCADRCKRCCVCREKIKSKILVFLQ